jgi:hypothetical protein
MISVTLFVVVLVLFFDTPLVVDLVLVAEKVKVFHQGERFRYRFSFKTLQANCFRTEKKGKNTVKDICDHAGELKVMGKRRPVSDVHGTGQVRTCSNRSSVKCIPIRMSFLQGEGKIIRNKCPKCRER